jgi:hypothetical protein
LFLWLNWKINNWCKKKLSKKQKPNKQKQTKNKEKNPTSLMMLLNIWYLMGLLFILVVYFNKTIVFYSNENLSFSKNSVWNLSDYLGIKSVYNLIHTMYTYTLHDEYTIHRYVCYIQLAIVVLCCSIILVFTRKNLIV